MIAVPALHATRTPARPDQAADHQHQHPGIAADVSESGSRADPDERSRTAVVGDAGHAWVDQRASEQPGVATIYQLAGINLRTNKIMFRTGVGSQSAVDRCGETGRLWLTTPYGQAARADRARRPRDRDRCSSTIHLRARALLRSSASAPGICSPRAGTSGTPAHDDLADQPAHRAGIPSGQARVRDTSARWWPRRRRCGTSSTTRASGGCGTSTGSRSASQQGLRLPADACLAQQSLVYGDGSIWALSDGEQSGRDRPGNGPRAAALSRTATTTRAARAAWTS